MGTLFTQSISPGPSSITSRLHCRHGGIDSTGKEGRGRLLLEAQLNPGQPGSRFFAGCLESAKDVLATRITRGRSRLEKPSGTLRCLDRAVPRPANGCPGILLAPEAAAVCIQVRRQELGRGNADRDRVQSGAHGGEFLVASSGQIGGMSLRATLRPGQPHGDGAEKQTGDRYHRAHSGGQAHSDPSTHHHHRGTREADHGPGRSWTVGGRSGRVSQLVLQCLDLIPQDFRLPEPSFEIIRVRTPDLRVDRFRFHSGELAAGLLEPAKGIRERREMRFRFLLLGEQRPSFRNRTIGRFEKLDLRFDIVEVQPDLTVPLEEGSLPTPGVPGRLELLDPQCDCLLQVLDFARQSLAPAPRLERLSRQRLECVAKLLERSLDLAVRSGGCPEELIVQLRIHELTLGDPCRPPVRFQRPEADPLADQVLVPTALAARAHRIPVAVEHFLSGGLIARDDGVAGEVTVHGDSASVGRPEPHFRLSRLSRPGLTELQESPFLRLAARESIQASQKGLEQGGLARPVEARDHHRTFLVREIEAPGMAPVFELDGLEARLAHVTPMARSALRRARSRSPSSTSSEAARIRSRPRRARWPTTSSREDSSASLSES